MMKYCGMNVQSESEVESLLMSPCWNQTQNVSADQFLLDGHKLLLDHDLDSLPGDDSDQKESLLDNLLLNSSTLNGSLSDLKPLPPFTGYTGHLSINGISGHHYHAIAQRLPDDSNNNNHSNANNNNNNNHNNNHNNNNNSNNNNNNNNSNNNNNNNNFMQSPFHHHQSSHQGSGGGGGGGGNNGNGGGSGGSTNGNNGNNGTTNNSTDHNIVSSSTCLPDSVLSSDCGTDCLQDVKLFAESPIETKLYSVADSCVMSDHSGGGPDSVSGGGGGVRIYTDTKDITEYVDMNSIDDIAAIIGSAIADTTVPNQIDNDDANTSRDSWMDIDAWIDGNCITQQDAKLIVTQHQDALNDFILPHSPLHHHSNSNSSTLQSLLTHGYMPLLQNRLQNGPPTIKTETPSSTSYCNELSSTNSPPGSVVSTTDNLLINGRYLTTTNSHHYGGLSISGLKSDGLCSPDHLLGNGNNNNNNNSNNYPHTTTITPVSVPKTKRSRTQKKHQQQQSQSQQQQQHQQHNNGILQNGGQQVTQSTVSFNNANDLSGLLGKEKPVHRCNICNRGFLNKSNIKVHLRTHTGEKPFRCDVCSKAFRQKAHLLKHQQIHKRIGRD